MSDAAERKCPRCKQSLPSSGYCLSCGYHAADIESKKFGAVQVANGRLERARAMGKFFRFLRWSHWVR